MCFSPQRRAIFWHRNFKKVVRSWRVLYNFTSKCASRHSGVQFLIFLWPHDSARVALTSLLFDSPGHTNHWKNTAFRDFSNIWRGWIFSLLTFALLHLRSSDFTSSLCFSSAFQFSILSEVYYLNFLRIFINLWNNYILFYCIFFSSNIFFKSTTYLN